MRTNQRVWPSRRRALCKRLDFSVQCCLFVQYDAVMSIDQIAFALPAALAVWLVAYVMLIRFFMPRVRVNSAARASSRAM